MANPLQIGALDAGSGSAWVQLMNSGLEDCPGFEPLIELDHQRLWGGDRARTGLTLAARRGEELLGAVSLIFGKHRSRLRDLAVRPDARRRGVGTALIEAAVDRFSKQDPHSSAVTLLGVDARFAPKGPADPASGPPDLAIRLEQGRIDEDSDPATPNRETTHPSTWPGLAEAQDWDAPSYRAFYEALGFRPVRRYLLLRWDLVSPLPPLPVNPEVTVRQATLQDLERIADLYARMYSPYWDWSREGTVEDFREEYRARFAHRLSQEHSDRVYLVAVLAGRLVGGITARIDRAYNQLKGMALGSLNPGGVGVLPAYRQHGIGSRLLAEALALLRERGMCHATVWTFSYLECQAPAVALYQRAGATVARRKLGWEKPL